MRILRDNSLLLFVLVFLQCCFPGRFALALSVLLAAYWNIRVNEKTWAVFLVLLVVLMPRNLPFPGSMKKAVITDVKERYCIARSGLSRVIIYTEEVMPFDAEIRITGEVKDITPSYSFYGFDSQRWCRRCGTQQYLNSDEITVTSRPVFSVRFLIQKRIEACEDEDARRFLYGTLLRITSSEDEDSFLCTFSASAAVLLTDALLRLFISERKKDRAVTVFAFLLAVIYRFDLSSTQIFFFRIWKLLYPEEKDPCPVLLFILLLYPAHALSAAFLIPAAYRLSRYTLHPRINAYTAVMMIESCLFHTVSPAKILIFPLLVRIRGIAWLLSVLQVVSGMPFTSVIPGGIRLLSDLQVFALKGSMIGAGLLFFLLLVYSFRRSRHLHLYVPVLFLFFLLSGLFHPFAEISFIDVSQGDSILIREPLGMHCVMIDTGKPTQYDAVSTFLDAKGINTVGTLVITHPDSDHNGNEASVCTDYHVRDLYKTHHDPAVCGYLTLYDLNDITDEDENRSSLVEYFRMNGMDILCMGDADRITEERMIRRFNDLHCDILKLSHHGSSTGSSEDFLDQVRPAVGIVSSGPYSLYHHPSPETVKRLMQRNIPFFDTKEEGDITILCLPYLNVLLTASKKMIFLPAGAHS